MEAKYTFDTYCDYDSPCCELCGPTVTARLVEVYQDGKKVTEVSMPSYWCSDGTFGQDEKEELQQAWDACTRGSGLPPLTDDNADWSGLE